MIDLYTWATPNGRKVSIMLEETGLDYTTHEVNIGKGEQRTPEFLAISPINKIPAIVDQDGPGGGPFTLFESGAILFYLAGKTGRFFPQGERSRHETMQWLMFQMGNFGPMLGQNHHFRGLDHEEAYSIERFATETARLYGVLDRHLAKQDFLAAGEYTIADMATYPWVARFQRHKTELADYPNVLRWFQALGRRPAVEKGMAVPFLN
ncbi:MAG: glutathione S-transferase N-terminal domain-containing protein [SAR324 cluster bacterium]|nr:glutathione S-transferase N-terminal domain-containing protein [SAR324 cluster bacterium]